MKNFNSAPSKNSEQDKPTEVKSTWDTLKNETFRGDQIKGQIKTEKSPDSSNNNAAPSPSTEEMRQQVLSVYNKTPEPSIQNQTDIKPTTPDQISTQTSTQKEPATSYDKAVNREVDFVLNKLRSGEKIPIPAETRQDSRPRGFEKFKKEILGSAIGSRLFRSRFEKDALNSHKAVAEAKRIYDSEDYNRRKTERARAEQAKIDQTQKNFSEIQAQREARAQTSLAEAIGSHSDRHGTIRRLNNLKQQEEYEKSYNEQLDDIDEIMSIAEVGTDGLSMGAPVEYSGQEIPVIINDGYPLHFLQSNLSYKAHDKIDADGKIIEGDKYVRTDAARKTLENPELWLQNEETYENAELESGNDKAISNVMSTSYVNTGYDPNGGVTKDTGDPYQVTYLFSHIRPGTLYKAVSTDGRTGPVKKHDIFSSAQDYNLDNIERARKEGDPELGSSEYNEISLYRYNENGEAQPPDALVVRDGKITEYTKKHAAFHHVPIIDIKTNKQF